MSDWLGVAAAEHVRRGVALGIAQIGHGRRGGLDRMRAGDTLVYYSAQERLGDRPTLRSFSAIGTLADDELWQADEGDFRPWRRQVRYEAAAVPVALADVRDDLVLTRDPHWGASLRRGLVPLDPHDVDVLRARMLASERE